MSQKQEYLSNDLVMSEYPNGFCVYERSSANLWEAEHTDGLLRVTLEKSKPALVMEHRYATPYDSFTKKQFQAVHNGSANETLIQRMLAAYNMDIDAFRGKLRTVGCGSAVYFQCADGIFLATVQRTATSQTPDGVVQAGSFSRAAGGATGYLRETQIRELVEEMNVFVRQDDGSVVSIDLFRTDSPTDDRTQQKFIGIKHAKLNEIYNQIAENIGSPTLSLTSEIFEAHAIDVKNLHETVEENICGIKSRFRAIVADDSQNGDLSGVDCLLVVPMQQYHSSQIYISDGERDQHDQLLGRTWQLARPEFLQANESSGKMKFSPVFGKTLRATVAILEEICRFNC